MKQYPFIDYHAHLFCFNEKELENIVKRAKENNVLIVNCGTGDNDNQKTIKQSRKHKFLTTIGIDAFNLESKVSNLEKQIQENKDIIIGIGEVGIDLHYTNKNLDEQIEVFLKMVELSIKYNLPLIIHTREAEHKLYEILSPYKGKIKGVLHSYQGDYKLAQKFIDEFGFYIGITGVVTYKNADEVKNLVKYIDLKHLLVETDSPYLNPLKYRIYKPKRLKNEPSFIIETYLEIAKIKNISLDKVKEQVAINFTNLFNKEL